jgi:hypothetical protein
MADEADKPAAPKTVQMPRTIHELRTGTKPEQMIEAKTIITDEVAKQHKLDSKAVEHLVGTGAVDMVDVLKG